MAFAVSCSSQACTSMCANLAGAWSTTLLQMSVKSLRTRLDVGLVHDLCRGRTPLHLRDALLQNGHRIDHELHLTFGGCHEKIRKLKWLPCNNDNLFESKKSYSTHTVNVCLSPDIYHTTFATLPGNTRARTGSDGHVCPFAGHRQRRWASLTLARAKAAVSELH